MHNIFLDNSSTTHLDPIVLQEMLPYFTDKYGNSVSLHKMGQEASKATDRAKEKIAKLIGAKSDQIFFTNSATESNNIILRSSSSCFRFLTTNSEHPSVSESIKYIDKHTQSGIVSQYIKVEKDGTIDLDKIEKKLKNYKIDLFSCIGVNNEIGTIHPIREIADMCKKYNVLFHSDFTQGVGKVSIDVSETNIFALSFSSHKIYGPKGAGCLYIRYPERVEALLLGGFQNTISSGTQNVPAIVGFGKACELMTNSKKENERIRQLRDSMLESLLEIQGSYINGTMQNRLPGNISITIPGINSRDLVMCLKNICVSSGSACQSSKPAPSDTMKAIGNKHHSSVIRICIGKFNTSDDVEMATNKIIYMVRKMRK